MFSKNLTPDKRLNAWRDVRNADYETTEDLLKEFADTKVINHFLDFYTPDTWPNVFDIVADGVICPTGLTLIIAATLHSRNFIKTDTIRFPVISNNVNGAVGAVLEYDNMVYNFLPGEAVTKEFMKENSTFYTEHEIEKEQLFK